MLRLWDILPRAIRFKWKSTVPTTLNKLQRASDQQFDQNDQSLLTPAAPRICHQQEAPKINCLTPFVSKLSTYRSTHEQSKGHDPNYCRRSDFLSRTFSVIGMGTVLAIGLQLNKYQWKLKNNSSNSESSWHQYITYALPLNRSAILDFDQKPSHSGFGEYKPEEFPEKNQESSDTLKGKLDSVMNEITAIDENIQGINSANGGDYESAVEHWKKSSVLGYPKSNFNLGLCYEKGKGVPKDLTKAKKYYQVAADQDHSQALFNLALLHFNSKNHTQVSLFLTAMNLLERAAKLGLPEAQTYLGVIYTESDEDKAVEMFQAAAEQQDTDALYNLGICFDTGTGVDQNESKAAELFTKAANNGHSGAQYSLANYYEQGLGGLPKDKKIAQELYLKSANAGNKDSKMRLQEISEEDTYKPGVISKMLSSMPLFESVGKVPQLATLFANSTSVMSLRGGNHNNNNKNNNLLVEERLSDHLLYMPHCSAQRDIPLPMASNPSEVLCS